MIAPLARLIENSSPRVACLLVLFSAFPLYASGEDFTDSIHAYLQRYVDGEKIKCGIVVGLIDEHGSNIVSCGKMDNGTDQDVNGDTQFELGSITKTFTGLLLEDMIQSGQMNLDDAVAKYLPVSVTVPSRNGKEISLRHLATHTSGLPREPDNLDPQRAESPGANYTVEKLYHFLNGYKLTREPGAEFEYSSLGIGLLAQAIALKAGADYETFVVDRICRPLAMDSTRITLTPELKSRFAAGHSQPGYVLPSPDFGSLAPAGALCSTANDMLKYLSANLGLTPSRLTPVMKKTHEVHYSQQQPEIDIGLAWVISRDPQGTEIIWHNGATYGSLAFVGVDKALHRGVVVLCNSRGVNDILDLGRFLLKCEWQSDHRPAKTTIDPPVDDDYVGDYRYSPDSSEKPPGVWRNISAHPKRLFSFRCLAASRCW